MKYRIVQRPTGYRSIGGGPLEEWPKEGEIVDLPAVQAEGMVRNGALEPVADEPKEEKRPAPTDGVETRESSAPRPTPKPQARGGKGGRNA